MSKYGFRFDLVETERSMSQLGDFLRSKPGTYDKQMHDQWVEETCIPAIRSDKRRALVWWQHDTMVGDVVLKPLDEAVEIKNFRVEDTVAGRGLADFMLRQAFHEVPILLRDKGIAFDKEVKVVLDTGLGGSAQAFFTHQGFVMTGAKELYTPGKFEALMERIIHI